MVTKDSLYELSNFLPNDCSQYCQLVPSHVYFSSCQHRLQLQYLWSIISECWPQYARLSASCRQTVIDGFIFTPTTDSTYTVHHVYKHTVYTTMCRDILYTPPRVQTYSIHHTNSTSITDTMTFSMNQQAAELF